MADITLHTRYIRDLSFENLTAPALPKGCEPLFNIECNIEIREQKNIQEVALATRVTALEEEKILFLIELSYAGLFEVHTNDKNAVELFLHTEAPRILFPFVDRICADIARDSGLPTLVLTPPDFAELYKKKSKASVA